jgi:hypothetical protein
VREFFRKLLENLFVRNPQFKQCQVVDLFTQKGIAWQTVYNFLNRHKNDQSYLDDTRLGSSSPWTSSMKGKWKSLLNNRKG